MKTTFAYEDLLDLVVSGIEQAENRGLSEIADGGHGFITALEHLQAEPRYLKTVVDAAGELVLHKLELIQKTLERKSTGNAVTNEERTAIKIWATASFTSLASLIMDLLTEINGARSIIAPNGILFMYPLFVPYADWEEGNSDENNEA